MPYYQINCAECGIPHSTYLPYINLTDNQIKGFCSGKPVQLRQENIPAGEEAPKGMIETEDQRTIGAVCCGSDSIDGDY